MLHNRTSSDQFVAEPYLISHLLKDKDFAYKVAKSQNDAYYAGIGENPPAFLEAGDEKKTVDKSAKEEKIAINLAGFYALECGVGALCERDGEKPTAWLARIIGGEMDVQDIFLLNHFANATWKAGQPFRGLDRITRSVFTVFSLLPQEEKEKDFVQIQNAAVKLLMSMDAIRDASAGEQMDFIKGLLQDETFTIEMAKFLAAAYYTGQNQESPQFISEEEELATVTKSASEEKIAMNLAGFYALESGVDYLVSIQNRLPSEILRSITGDTIIPAERQLMCRLANATWKAGQPFRSLDRITREVFKPFDLLSEEDKSKDWAQIAGAAAIVLAELG